MNAAAALALHPPSTTAGATTARTSSTRTSARIRRTARNSLGAADASGTARGHAAAERPADLRIHPARRTPTRTGATAALVDADRLPALPVGVALGVLVCYAVALG